MRGLDLPAPPWAVGLDEEAWVARMLAAAQAELAGGTAPGEQLQGEAGGDQEQTLSRTKKKKLKKKKKKKKKKKGETTELEEPGEEAHAEEAHADEGGVRAPYTEHSTQAEER